VVTGGAGYIGAHVVRSLRAAGRDVLVVDDLSTGRAERVRDVPLLRLDLADPAGVPVLAAAMREHGVDAVVHLAGKKRVEESFARPEWYEAQNVGSLRVVLAAMAAQGVDRLVFSSSAAVYGEPGVTHVTEDVEPRPINPYGETKLAGERLIAATPGLRHVSLRYFNVIGAGSRELGDPTVLNLLTIVLDLLEQGRRPRVFGSDYPTPDGTCVRDFVHVEDLAEAHLAALDHLEREERPVDVLNVGTGRGHSVLEVLDAVRRASGCEVVPEFVGRRPGDPAEMVARVDRIAEVLGWRARLGLEEAVTSAWEAWRHDRERGLPVVRASD